MQFSNGLLIIAGTALLVVLLVLLWTARRVGQAFALLKQTHDLTYKVGHQNMTALFQQLQLVRILEHELHMESPLPPLRGFAASPDFLLLISRHARKARPQTVVECSSGTSTLVLARCMQINGSGKVYSLEHDAFFAEQTRENLRRFGLEEWAEVIDAPLTPTSLREKSWQWYSTDRLPETTIDMLVVDGPPFFVDELARYPAGPVLFPRLTPKAVVFVDDAGREEERKMVVRWREEFQALDVQEHYCEKGCVSLTAA